MKVRHISSKLDAAGLTFAVVVSRFNDFLTKELLSGAIDCIERHGGGDDAVTAIWVPGANESPSIVSRLARSGAYSAIIVVGAVIDGATAHADLIASQVSRNLAQISIGENVPVINGIVCAHTLEQAIERCGTKGGNKGWQAAMAAIEMANLYRDLPEGGL